MMWPPQSVKMAPTPSCLRARATRWPPLTVATRSPRARLEMGGHVAPLNFAGRGARQSVGDEDLLGHLEIGEPFLAKGEDLLRAGERLEHYGGVHFLTVLGVGHREANRLRHRGMLQQHSVDLERRNLLA